MRVRCLPLLFGLIFLSSSAQAQSIWDRARGAAGNAAISAADSAAAAAARARDWSIQEFGRLVEAGQNIPQSVRDSVPNGVRDGYQSTVDTLGPQVEQLTILGLIGGSASEAAYATSRVPGMAWRIFWFSCSNEEKLDQQILCPALTHYKNLNEVSAKFNARIPIESTDVRKLVDLTLYLLETQQKVIGKCATNSRVNKCINKGATDAIWSAITSRSTDSLETYAAGLADGRVLFEALNCIWPTMYQMALNNTAPEICRAP